MNAQLMKIEIHTIKYFHALTGYIELNKTDLIWSGNCIFGDSEVLVTMDFSCAIEDIDEEIFEESQFEILSKCIKNYTDSLEGINNRYDSAIDEVLMSMAIKTLTWNNNEVSLTELDSTKKALSREFVITGLNMDSMEKVCLTYFSDLNGSRIVDSIIWDSKEKKVINSLEQKELKQDVWLKQLIVLFVMESKKIHDTSLPALD